MCRLFILLGFRFSQNILLRYVVIIVYYFVMMIFVKNSKVYKE